MKVTWLGANGDGTRAFEVEEREIAWSALVRFMRKIPDARVKDTTYNLRSESRATITYRDIVIHVYARWADFIFECKSESATLDEFVDVLRKHRVRWWERFL